MTEQWSKPFQRRCPARATGPEGSFRCDLRRGHGGSAHAAEFGMHNIYWSTWTTTVKERIS